MFDASNVRARSDIASDDYLFWTNTGDGLDGDVYKLTLAELIAMSITSAGTITSSSASALVVGPNGGTNPVFQIDASTASAAAGLKLTGAVAAGVVALAVISSGSNASLTINAKGTGTIGIGSVSTGAVTITPATTVTGLLTLTAGIDGKFITAGIETIAAGGTSTALSLTKTLHSIDADAGGDTFTLADGTIGQIMVITMKSSTGTATVTPANLAGGTSVTFNAAGDSVVLQFVDTEWYIIGGNSYAVI